MDDDDSGATWGGRTVESSAVAAELENLDQEIQREFGNNISGLTSDDLVASSSPLPQHGRHQPHQPTHTHAQHTRPRQPRAQPHNHLPSPQQKPPQHEPLPPASASASAVSSALSVAALPPPYRGNVENRTLQAEEELKTVNAKLGESRQALSELQAAAAKAQERSSLAYKELEHVAGVIAEVSDIAE
jgi:hypothetical protein